MIFNSLNFAIFFLVVYLLYLAAPHKWQNRLLLIASYVFYSFWDWRFLSLIILSTIFNYYLGIKIAEATHQKNRKLYFWLSICFNLGMLGFFKYFNFFAANLSSFLGSFGWHVDGLTLNIILPLGISFYTFQAMSYPIDINRGMIRPTRNFLDFALFITFFPLLGAGPIERARNLLPQIENRRDITLKRFYEGSWLFFWGLYKKILIADNLAKIANAALGTFGILSGVDTLVASYLVVFRIYADFSGYSDMARGISRVMGFNIMANFKVPFFSVNIADFWQRWHISLTTWIKEYLFYPLALIRVFGKQLSATFVIIITWALMGFWHGPAPVFVVWGIYHGIIIVIYSRLRPYLRLINPKNIVAAKSLIALRVITIFNLFSLGILFFALERVSQVFAAWHKIFFNFGTSRLCNFDFAIWMIILLVPLFLIEYFQRKNDDEMIIFKWPALARGVVYYILLYSIIMYGNFNAQKYFYFQF